MPPSSQSRRRYDHRIRDAVLQGRDLAVLQKLAIPASTCRSWQRRGAAPVVSLHPRDAELRELQATIVSLEQRAARLLAIVHLLIALVRATGARIDEKRMPDGAAKARLLRAVSGASDVAVPPVEHEVADGEAFVGRETVRERARARRSIVEGAGRFSTLPGAQPAVGQPGEPERGVPADQAAVGSLALLAARTGRVLASARTWHTLIRRNSCRRPRARVYPAKPSVGVRAVRPNEWWHIDVTIVRLLDGSRAYVHGVVDNYSRKVLAWCVEPELRTESTRAILVEAREAHAPDGKVKVLTDGGSENIIIAKDTDLVALAEHVVAQVSVHFSNSMIEAFWKPLRHQWLYLQQLDSIATLRRLVAEYVADHNALIPREQLGGRTPDEAYAGLVIQSLGPARTAARRARIEVNRTVRCGSCPPRSEITGPAP